MTYKQVAQLAVKDYEEAEILGIGFDNNFYQNGCCEDGIPRSCAFYLEVQTRENWQMGDFCFYEGKKYCVFKRNIVFKNGELSFTYRLGMQGTYYQRRIYNKALKGVRLEGVIKKTEEENVYLQLDIDKDEKADYPWIWAPETNNLCYCMPEIETKAALYFPTQEEQDGQGIQMKSNTNISFIADGEVYWEGRNINAAAPLEVICRTSESNIELCRDINLYAPGGVKTVGTGNGAKKKTDLDGKQNVTGQEIEHWQASFTAMAAVPEVDLEKVQGQENIVNLFACGGVPKIANGSTTIALSEVMDGKKESESSFPEAFKSMENYTVKGGYALPEDRADL